MEMTIPRESRPKQPPSAVALPYVAVAPSVAAEAYPETAERSRRPLNVVLAAIAIVLLSPVMLVIALLIKLTSRGPVFYTQTRVGWDRRSTRPGPPDERRREDIGGLPFKIYKFRSMHVNAEHLTGAVWAAKEDPRVTWLGQYLRQYRLDELPQLINVIKGDMNVVGPRPERPTIFADLRREITEYPRRQRARPGITGLAQVNQQYDTSLDDVRNKVRFDLEYIRRQGLLEDMRIMLKTIPVVLFRRGGW
ncbi:MAG TPA: sugar transferase [Gemmatimonadales bacterium]|nr:sugar transferase [Gemmatimonadales bacterium]